MTPEAIEELRRLEREATAGPWHVDNVREEFWRVRGPGESIAFDDGSACDEYNKECSEQNRDLIIAMRNALPALLDSLASERTLRQRAEGELARVRLYAWNQSQRRYYEGGGKDPGEHWQDALKEIANGEPSAHGDREGRGDG